MMMDIERLKELKEFLSCSFFYYGRRSGKTITSEFFRDVELLIDEAIANQAIAKAATSEEVQRAIDFMENELKILESFTSKYECFSKNISIFKTILTALQQYQPKGE